MTKKTKAQAIKEKQKSPPPLKRYISFIIAHQYIDKIFRVLNPFSYRTRCYTNQFQNIVIKEQSAKGHNNRMNMCSEIEPTTKK